MSKKCIHFLGHSVLCKKDQEDQNLKLFRKMYLNNTHRKKICARSSYHKIFQANYMDGDETDKHDQNLRLVRKNVFKQHPL